MMAKKTSRDDDSAEAVKVDVADAKERLANIESALTNATHLGDLIVPALQESVELRKQLATSFIEIMDDYDNRKELKKIVDKIDRSQLWRWGKYLLGAVVWLASVLACLFGYMAIKG